MISLVAQPANHDSRGVCGVVVTYFPAVDFGGRLARMARQVRVMIVVDNSATEEVQLRIAEVAERYGCRFKPQTQNIGIAAALNAAFAEVERDGFEWVVAFDQDSTPEDGCVCALLRLAETRPRAALVGSNWSDEARPLHVTRHLVHGRGFVPWFRRLTATNDLNDVTFVITSGSLMRVEAWRQIQGFRNELFLDLVDVEFCLRAACYGWTVHVAAAARLRHRRGQKVAVRWAGRTWWPAQLPPQRIRLIVRNRLWALWSYGWTRWPWATFEVTHTVFMLFSALCLEENRRPKLAAFFAGIGDALRGVLGAPVWATQVPKPISTSTDQTTPF